MQLIAKADAQAMGKGENLSGIGLYRSGTYYLMVTSKGYHSNTLDPYTLNLSVDPVSDDVELEPNNNFEHAFLIKTTNVSAQINFPGDRDFFYVPVTESGGTYRIECIPDTEMDPSITLFDAQRREVIRIDNNRGNGSREILPAYTFSNPFYILIEDRSGLVGKLFQYDIHVNTVTDTKDL